MVAYDNLGRSVILDMYFSKSAANTWEVTIYNQADAAPNTSFPYANPAMVTQTLNFDATNGKLTAASPKSVTLNIPGGQPLTIDMKDMTQLAQSYTPITAKLNGSAPSPIDSVKTGADGTVYAQYTNGSIKALYRIPLGDVPSPDELSTLPATSTPRATRRVRSSSASPAKAATAPCSRAPSRAPTSTLPRN